METTFYHDEGMAARKNFKDKTSVEKLKSRMTLDFNMGPPNKKQLLQSPDLNLLKLASPELEKLIIQHNGMVTTPTPTQILFPRSVTEEQEAYARGFVDALAQLHKKEGDDSSTDGEMDPFDPAQGQLVMLQNAAPVANSAYNFTTLTSLPESHPTSTQPSRNSTPFSHGKANGHPLPTTVTSQAGIPAHSHEVPRNNSPFVPHGGMGSQLLKLKEEPQTVPSLSNTPPISPINMHVQEKQKVERKRARNRVAARKCRFRKLERINRLEDRVTDLKNLNSELSNDATKLKEHVLKLKQQILEHVNSGCNIMISGAL